MDETALNRESEDLLPGFFPVKDTNEYIVGTTGAKVTAASSIAVVVEYCNKLPKNKYYTTRPLFESIAHSDGFECVLTLPSSDVLPPLRGPKARSKKAAKQLVCFDACKKLHQLGVLDESLRPFVVKPLPLPGISIKTTAHSSSDGVGTTKRKELHGTTGVRALYGTWALEKNVVKLQGYRLKFSCNQVGQRYFDFVLLVDATLAIEGDNLDIDLYLHDKMVKASVSPCGLLELGVQQMEQAKLFQALMFNSLFGKLFTGSKSSSIPREFIFNKNDAFIWNVAKMYLILPIDPTLKPHDNFCINWRVIDDAATTIRLMKKIYSGDKMNIQGILDFEQNDTELIHLANISCEAHDLRNVVVLAVHTGRIYTAIHAVDLSANSTFDGVSDKKETKFHTFTEYFENTHGIVLRHPSQPLLAVKPNHKPHNLLSSKFKNEGNHAKTNGDTSHVNNEDSCVHMPPELLMPLNLSEDILRAFYLFPSLMHRIETLMLASQLRSEISYDDSNISSFLILEAITTLRCSEDFSMERLELLGDSVLKYAVSCHLFLESPDKDEGHLSSSRAAIISNAALYGLGMERKIQTNPITGGIHVIHRGGGLRAAVAVLKWLGVDAEIEEELIVHTILSAPVKNCLPKIGVIGMLEAKLGYTFSLKGLLLEALTHPSQPESAERYSYQRLEFLGDAVLDILITQHLFNSHEDTDEGELTDLRSASVNNENFAQVAVLGDIIESIAGAILIDAKLDLDVVWGVFRPLLSPIVTPANLELPPFRELLELCSKNGYFLETNFTNGEKIEATLLVQLKEKLILRQSCGKSKKDAKAHAASKLLEDLEKEGLLIPKNAGRMKQLQKQHGGTASRCNNVFEAMDTQPPTPTSGKKSDASKIIASLDKPVHVPVNTSRGGPRAALQGEGLLIPKNASRTEQLQKKGGTADLCNNLFDAMDTQLPTTTNGKTSYGSKIVASLDKPVNVPVKTSKGGPRAALYEFCQKLQWPVPYFNSVKVEPSCAKATPQGFSFASTVILSIPNSDVISLTGDSFADKKSTMDSAALLMLQELQRRAKLQVQEA
ncbi:hypothetical protein ACQ4PT_041438 [Festuca glaucescens]